MSNCTESEIAEKRRIALAKLQAKKCQFTGKTVETRPLNPQKTNGNASNQAAQFFNAVRNNPSFRDRTSTNGAHPYKRDAKVKTNVSDEPSKPTLFGAPVAITCRVYVINPNRFAVQPSGYHDKLIEAFKKMPTKNYNAKTRIWDFALTDYVDLQKQVHELKPHIVMGVIPPNVLKICAEPRKQLDYACLASIEPSLVTKLMPFQREGVCFAIAQHGRLMICDEMGLGKTYQAIAVADYYREDWPMLVCTTASTRDAWANYMRTLLPSVPLHNIQVMSTPQSYIGDAKVLVTSYSMMERHAKLLVEHQFGFLIFDESQNLKNKKAGCTEVATRLASNAKHILLLSGTPALSRPLELFAQLNLIDRKFMSFTNFTSRYCDGKQTRFGWNANGQSNLEELNVWLKLRYMVRRTKEDVLPDLAEKTRETVILDPDLIPTNTEALRKLDSMHQKFVKSAENPNNKLLLQYYSETAELKTAAVCAYLKTIIKEPIKFIVFAYHHIMLNAICDCLSKHKVHYMRIDGNTNNNLRTEYIDAFQTKPHCRVGVLSLTACNAGITLTAAELIVFAELHWNPSTLTQAESRAHRIGQDKPVICRYLIANKTVDDILWNMLKSKQDVLNKAGLFCEDLQDTEYNLAPSTSRKIDSFFTPTKPKTEPIKATPTIDSSESVKPKKVAEVDSSLRKELENIDQFFAEDDDSMEGNSSFKCSNKEAQENDIRNTSGKQAVNPELQTYKEELENIDQFFAEDDYSMHSGSFFKGLSKEAQENNCRNNNGKLAVNPEPNTYKEELENIDQFFTEDGDSMEDVSSFKGLKRDTPENGSRDTNGELVSPELQTYKEELKNIEQFFAENDDDDAFMDLDF